MAISLSYITLAFAHTERAVGCTQVGTLVDRHLGAGAQAAYGGQLGAWEPRSAAVEQLRDLVTDAGGGGGLSAAGSLAYGDEKVANRDIRVWHGATKMVLD